MKSVKQKLGSKWIHHIESGRNMRVRPEQVKAFLKSGWALGTYKRKKSK